MNQSEKTLCDLPNSDSDCPVLYHYTSIDALCSIINSGTIWASDCRYLNDTTELTKATEKFLSKFNGKTKTALECAFHWHNHTRCLGVFSLSNSPKILSQWRAYAEDGRGAAIGFRTNFLNLSSTPNSGKLVQCIYENHDKFLSEIIEKNTLHITEITNIYQKNSAINTFWNEINNNPIGIEALYLELLRMKNFAFIEENESRLIFNASAEAAKLRVSKGLMIPYLLHQFTDGANRGYMDIRMPEIWFGPKSDSRNLISLSTLGNFWIPGINLHKYECGYI